MKVRLGMTPILTTAPWTTAPWVTAPWVTALRPRAEVRFAWTTASEIFGTSLPALIGYRIIRSRWSRRNTIRLAGEIRRLAGEVLRLAGEVSGTKQGIRQMADQLAFRQPRQT